MLEARQQIERLERRLRTHRDDEETFRELMRLLLEPRMPAADLQQLQRQGQMLGALVRATTVRRSASHLAPSTTPNDSGDERSRFGYRLYLRCAPS